MRKHPQSGNFEQDPRSLPGYEIVEYPMCLKWIGENIRLTEETTQLIKKCEKSISFLPVHIKSSDT
eukprot:UN20514